MIVTIDASASTAPLILDAEAQAYTFSFQFGAANARQAATGNYRLAALSGETLVGDEVALQGSFFVRVVRAESITLNPDTQELLFARSIPNSNFFYYHVLEYTQSTVNSFNFDDSEGLRLTISGDSGVSLWDLDGTTGSELLANENRITGTSFDDSLDGGPGVDTMAGGDGNDVYVVDNSADAVTEALGAGHDLVESAVSYALVANLEDLALTGAANINGTGNTLGNRIVGNTGNNFLSGDLGDDSVTGGGGDDTIAGGQGKDTLVGNIGKDNLNGGNEDDRLFGGLGNDTINGGNGKDTAVFLSSEALPVSWIDSENLDNDNVIKIYSGTEGTDTLTNVEIGDFGGHKVPLTKWHVIVSRDLDGIGTLSFFENGTLIKTVACAYDEATPIPDGNYSAIFRTNGSGAHNNHTIELSYYSGISSVTDPVLRTNVQIHDGVHSGNSEGCFVVEHSLWRPLLERIGSACTDLGMGTDVGVNGQTYYKLPVPITVECQGNIPQPTLNFSADATIGESNIAQTYTAHINLRDGSDNVFDYKKVDVFLTVDASSTATMGTDWTFGTGVQKVSGVDVWKVTLNKGTSQIDVPIRILADCPDTTQEEKINIKISDINLWRFSGGQWKWHSDSQSDANKYKDPTPVEHLLFGDDTLSLTIRDRPAAVAFGTSLEPSTPDSAAHASTLSGGDMEHHSLDWLI